MLKDWKRYVTGLSLMPVVLGIVYWLPDNYFMYLIVITAFFAFSEYLAMFKERKHPFFIIIAVTMLFMVESIGSMSSLMKLSTITVGEVEKLFYPLRQFSLSLFSAVILIPVFSLYGKDQIEVKFKRMFIYFFGFFYFGLTFGLFPAIRHFTVHNHWLAFALVTPWICDTAAYFGGRFLGKHKFAPLISPKKTWEGAVSGTVFSMITGAVFHLTLLKDENIFFILTVSFLIGTFGQLGDLVESLIKRGAGVKDSGNIFPGHGGILDRTDSLVVSVTVIFISFVIKSYVS
jgi:phosphatidate cytidylyltransferase